MAESTSSGAAPQTPGPAIEVQVKALEGQVKEGRVRQFTVMSDEGERIGGTDTAPSPLAYFTLGIGF
ncbi:MAG TPA: hypothetical protein VGK54_19230 [Chloroflexota bacterium]|jgi:hypothetical protein